MQKKDDKVGNKTANKEGKEGKKQIERERSKLIRKKKVKIAHAWKTKKLSNYVRLVGKYAFFLPKLVFSHSYAN